MPTWAARFEEAFKTQDDDQFHPADAASDEQIADITAQTGLAVPNDLADALREADGITASGAGDVLMSCENIINWTDENRSNYADWDDCEHVPHLLFFSDCGTGDFFAYHLKPKSKPQIVFFDHESGEIKRIAPDLASFLKFVKENDSF